MDTEPAACRQRDTRCYYATLHSTTFVWSSTKSLLVVCNLTITLRVGIQHCLERLNLRPTVLGIRLCRVRMLSIWTHYLQRSECARPVLSRHDRRNHPWSLGGLCFPVVGYSGMGHLRNNEEKMGDLRRWSKGNHMIEHKYRTLWKRLCAGFVDGLALLPISLLTNWIWAHHQSIPNPLLALLHLSTSFIYYGYNIYFLGKYGQTLGKMALNVKVLDMSEQRHITYLQALRRDIVPIAITVLLLPYEMYKIITGTHYLLIPGTPPDKISTVLGFVLMGWFLLEFITMMFNRKWRAIHDLIAGSVVVRM